MKKHDIQKEPLWRLALQFGIVFIVIVVMIQFVWEVFESGNTKAITESFHNGKWINYLITKILIGVVYGFTMAWYTKKNTKKYR